MSGHQTLFSTNTKNPLRAKVRRRPSCSASYSDNDNNLRPFIKWAGGKGQLLSEIRKIYPRELGTTIKKYAEPFVGGGAVLFDILSSFPLDSIYISDTNIDLINTYTIIQQNLSALFSQLYDLQNNYIAKSYEERQEYYMKGRKHFNELKINNSISDNIEKAALFIFLNKTCFNGLYRVNRKGLFNVPMGAYKNPLIFDEIKLQAISQALSNVNIVCADYHKSTDFIDQNTLVYFDPPYRPLTATANFTAYTEILFDDKSQIELSDYIKMLDKRKAKIILSNSDPKNNDPNDEFFDNLYCEFDIIRIKATRMINCNAKSRGKISELLIKNYSLNE